MTHFRVILPKTYEQNRIAQTRLFKEGYSWGFSRQEVTTRTNEVIWVSDNSVNLTYSSVHYLTTGGNTDPYTDVTAQYVKRKRRRVL